MPVKCVVKKNTYYDSILLMRISSELSRSAGIHDIAVLMGTKVNKTNIEKGVLYTDEVRNATANDLFISVSADSEELAEQALFRAQEMIENAAAGKSENALPEAWSLDAALRSQKGSNIALFSLPGTYVFSEAQKALEAGLNLMIFSDNVPVEEEIALKALGKEKGLLVMGPDCGTAIINGAALAFANAVRRGRIGIVGASGTGIQEVSCLIHDLGFGISHAIGTGSRDVKSAVGGMMTIEGIKLLAQDKATERIVVVSKAPDPEVFVKIEETASAARKPVVLAFLGSEEGMADRPANNIDYAYTLEDAALKAVSALESATTKAVGVSENDAVKAATPEDIAVETTRQIGKDGLAYANNRFADWVRGQSAILEQAKESLAPGQKYIRGLFCGGTFTGESAAILISKGIDPLYSNAHVPGILTLDRAVQSRAHTCLDMGDDAFTRGKPHPMIEPFLRHGRILVEASEPETAVLLLDVVLGYGSHHDPAGVLAESLREADQIAEKAGRVLVKIVYLCGVQGDPQDCEAQKNKLIEAGCIVAPTSKAAASIAAMIVGGRSD